MEDIDVDDMESLKGLLRRHGNTPTALRTEPSNNNSGKEDEEESPYLQQGKFTLQTRRAEDPLHFIHRIHSYTHEDLDPETEELVHIIRSTHTSAKEDRERDVRKQTVRSLITAALVQQFDNAALSVETSDVNGDGSSEQSSPAVRSALSPAARPREDLEARRSLQQVRFEECPVREFIDDEVEETSTGPPPIQSLDEFDISDHEDECHCPPRLEPQLSVSLASHQDIPFIDDSDGSEEDEAGGSVVLMVDHTLNVPHTSDRIQVEELGLDHRSSEPEIGEKDDISLGNAAQLCELKPIDRGDVYKLIRGVESKGTNAHESHTEVMNSGELDEQYITSELPLNGTAVNEGALIEMDVDDAESNDLDQWHSSGFTSAAEVVVIQPGIKQGEKLLESDITHANHEPASELDVEFENGFEIINIEEVKSEMKGADIDDDIISSLEQLDIVREGNEADTKQQEVSAASSDSQQDCSTMARGTDAFKFEQNTDQMVDGTCQSSSPLPCQSDPDIEDVAIAADEPLSHKEVLASKEEECSKERASTSSSLDDLDFSLVQSSNPLLNIVASKDRAQLRQKGSLAQRRKPTRPSIRPLGPEEDSIFSPIQGSNDDVVMNGHGSEDRSSEHEHVDDVNMAGSALLTSQPIPGIHKGIILPGLGSGVKPKLRSKPPKPTPNDMTAAESTSAAKPDTPPWFGHAKLRKTRPPKGEVEKMKQETEPETPAWMKDAEAKRKRASGIMNIKRASRQGPESNQVVPQLKPITMPKETTASPLPCASVIVQSTTAATDAPSSPTLMMPLMVMETPEPPIIHSTAEDSTEVNDVVEMALDSSHEEESMEHLSSPHNNPPLPLSPIPSNKSPPLSRNSPPLQHNSPQPLPRKMVLPPLQPPAAVSSNPPVPAWKNEIAARRKSKTFLPPVSKPEPMISEEEELPPWKRELAQRKKNRRTPDEVQTPSPTQSPSAAAPPWMQEIEQRKKRSLTSTGSPKVLNPLMLGVSGSKENTDVDMPDWARVAAERRAKRKNSTGFSNLSVSDDEES